MKFDISFNQIIKIIILNDNKLSKYYNNDYPNKKHSIDFIIDELIYVLKTGISWRNIRSTIKWQTLYWHYRRLVDRNIFHKTFNFLRRKYFSNNKNNIQLVDSSFVQNKYGKNKISRNKFFKNKNCNKISILTDINGIPLSVLVNKGSVHDITFVDKHVEDSYFIYKYKNNQLLADKAYESKKLRDFLKNNNYQLMVPKKRRAKINYYFDKTIYKNRIKVENTFQKLKSYRRVMIRYDSLYKNYYSFVLLASSLIIYNFIQK
jgi:transposase